MLYKLNRPIIPVCKIFASLGTRRDNKNGTHQKMMDAI